MPALSTSVRPGTLSAQLPSLPEAPKNTKRSSPPGRLPTSRPSTSSIAHKEINIPTTHHKPISPKTEFLNLSDGTLSEAYYRDDHIDLTVKGQNKLATKLELMSFGNETPINVTTFRTNKEKKSREKSPTTKYTYQMTTRTNVINTLRYIYQHSKTKLCHTHEHQKGSITTNHTVFCAGPHHDMDRCRHQRPVQCYSCSQTGHKYNIVTQPIVIDGQAKKNVPLVKIISLVKILMPMFMI